MSSLAVDFAVHTRLHGQHVGADPLPPRVLESFLAEVVSADAFEVRVHKLRVQLKMLSDDGEWRALDLGQACVTMHSSAPSAEPPAMVLCQEGTEAELPAMTIPVSLRQDHGNDKPPVTAVRLTYLLAGNAPQEAITGQPRGKTDPIACLDLSLPEICVISSSCSANGQPRCNHNKKHL